MIFIFILLTGGACIFDMCEAATCDGGGYVKMLDVSTIFHSIKILGL